jgi:ParB-like chromosome segregation protein Spo0J
VIETERKVHPAAAVFPRLSEDELRELADDIKANGLHHAIVLDSEGRIVDGINRDIACGMAGVKPTYITLPAETDIEAYILSENIRRRHMSKGQQAVAIAMMIETAEGKRDGRAKHLISDSDIRQSTVSEAVLIRRYAPELAPGVLAGTEKFDAALLAAKARKREQDDATEAKKRQAREDDIEIGRIRRIDPGLADLIPDTLTVTEAKATLAQRQQRERDRKESTTRLAESAFSFLDPGLAATPGERAAQIIATLDASVISTRPDLSSARGYRCAATLQVLCELLRQREEEQHGRRT